jgi:NAD(P)-dependent dehydrogenase (short-subunit alcohol dehydrogenase family)
MNAVECTPKQRVAISGAETDLGSLLVDRLGERVAAASQDALTVCWIAEQREIESIVGTDPLRWQETVDGALSQLHEVLRPAFAAMSLARWGRVVLVPPSSHLRGPVAMAAIGLMRTLRLEGRRGIKINVVLPGASMERDVEQVLSCCSANNSCPAGMIFENGEPLPLETGQGVARSGDITPETVAADFESITSLSDAQVVTRPTAALALMLDLVDEALPARQPEGSAPIRFDGEVAIVTGAGGGLGRCYALALAERGARVVVNDIGANIAGGGRSSTPADSVAAEITAAGGMAIANCDSVTTPTSAEAIVSCAVDTFGRLDIVVNNAGILRDGSFELLSPADWQAVVDVHLHGSYNITHAALRKMLRAGRGRIILTTSAAALYGNARQSSYTAAKSATLGLMNAACADVEGADIAINAIAPLAATRMTDELFPPDLLANLQPTLVAPLLLYLCSSACVTKGMVLNAAMGFFNRVRLTPAGSSQRPDGH